MRWVPDISLAKVFLELSGFCSCPLSRGATEQAAVPPACKQEHLKAAKSRVVWRLLSTLPQPSFTPPNIPLAAGKNIKIAFPQPAKCLCVPLATLGKQSEQVPKVADGSVHMDLCLPWRKMLFQVYRTSSLISQPCHALSPTQQELKGQELCEPSCAEAPALRKPSIPAVCCNALL